MTGSKHGAYEDHAFIPALERFIREAHAGDVPLVGVCFGHQIAAQALGGRVVKHIGGWSLGRQIYETAGGGRLALNAWHQDQVVDLPEGAVCLAGSASCPNAILAYGNRVLTVQPHPEYGSDLIADFVALRQGTGTYPDDRMEAAKEDRHSAVDNVRLGAVIARFFLTRHADVDA
ncbi:type 1 glutamine amidotransferase [Jannaschia sp. S6380]|uniref:type 1 glutamine amidotransferase n=1 Tax=Jannaschia sp. S6380 TaxID=2926408 RepID=UPI001FF5DEE9|nr:type 1 glutamine amidotransferase [Jannaschia sp. S6380]